VIELLLQAERALSVGLLDQAERLYRQAADLDPRNSIAVVGLARVALERDDESLAHDLARRALAIDPENAAAQRMVERLEEVMRYRGDEPPPARPEPTGSAPAAPAESAPAPPQRPEPPAATRRRSLLDRIRGRR
jgi:tetratricopeptide (TPR) repeat protein